MRDVWQQRAKEAEVPLETFTSALDELEGEWPGRPWDVLREEATR